MYYNTHIYNLEAVDTIYNVVEPAVFHQVWALFTLQKLFSLVQGFGLVSCSILY
jgi:hypothetical protein